LLVAEAVRSQAKGLIHPFQRCRSGTERDIDRIRAIERGNVDGGQRRCCIPQASTLDDQLGRNVAAAEGVAPATRQPGSGATSIVFTGASGQKDALAAAAPTTTASEWRRQTARMRTSTLVAESC